jgi:hypothetical protein
MAVKSDPNAPGARDASGQVGYDKFRIRRFRLADGQEIKLYCRLVKSRPGPAASFNLYEDNRGLKWMDITVNDQSLLIAIADKSFEQQVAEELLTLGFNKYSG